MRGELMRPAPLCQFECHGLDCDSTCPSQIRSRSSRCSICRRQVLPKQKGRNAFALRPDAQAALSSQYSRKLTSTVIITGTGVRPSFIAGLNLYLRTASRAFSSRPMPSVRITRGFCGLPCASTISEMRQTPWYLARRASSENSASTLFSAPGAEMPPPTLYNPPPVLPPVPGPYPFPVPEPIPPPYPVPMPVPPPSPFEASVTLADLVTPSVGSEGLSGSLISGWTLIAGSMASFGLSTVCTCGGVTGSLDFLGMRPLTGSTRLWSPPPPPPPACGPLGPISLKSPTSMTLAVSRGLITFSMKILAPK